MTYSPSFILDVVTPYTEQEAQQTQTDQENAGQTWQDNLTKYGDTKKARDETVKAVKKLEGVKTAGVSSDGVNIWIEFKSGIRGGLMLSQEGSGTGGTAGPFVEGMAQAVRRRADRPLGVLPTSCKQESDTAGGTSSVGNCNVLIWDKYAEDYEHVDITPFASDPSKKFQIHREYGDEDNKHCTVDSLREITEYGTVIIRTPGQKGRVSPLYSTNEVVTWQKLGEEKYMLDLLTGCLEAFINMGGVWEFYFTPSFISTLEGQFDKSIVYVEAAYGSELASAFLSKGAHTFFGYSGEPDYAWMIDTGKKLFTSMVKDGKDTGEAYAAIPERSKGSSYFLWFSSSIDGISYDCGPKKADGRIGVQMNSHVIYQPPNRPPYKYDEERGYRAGGSHPDFTGQFLNNIFKMTWDFNIYGSRLWGEMEVTLDKEPSGATKVISFWAWEKQQELGGEFGYRYMIIQGGNINFTEKTDYLLTFEARGSEVCNYVTEAIGYTSGNKTDGLHEYWFNGFECNNKSILNIYFEFVK